MCSTQRESAYLEMLSSNAHNFLKSIVDVNPKVLQDLSNILEKFPCNYWIAGPLAGFVSGFIHLTLYLSKIKTFIIH